MFHGAWSCCSDESRGRLYNTRIALVFAPVPSRPSINNCSSALTFTHPRGKYCPAHRSICIFRLPPLASLTNKQCRSTIRPTAKKGSSGVVRPSKNSTNNSNRPAFRSPTKISPSSKESSTSSPNVANPSNQYFKNGRFLES